MATLSYVEALRLVLDDYGLEIATKELAAAMSQAATLFLEPAAQGRQVTDHLTREQTGLILAALQWNFNPMVHQAIKARPK